MYQPDIPTVPLTPLGPRADATSGEPFESILEISNEGGISIGVWECTPGAFPSAREGYSEFMYFLAGDATITDADGTRHAIRPGVGMLLTDGWHGAWEIRETIRKVYVSVRPEA